MGDHDRSTSDGEQSLDVRSGTYICTFKFVCTFVFFSEILFHPDFDPADHANDFAIFKLASPVIFSDSVAPICLPSATTDYDNKVATVSGWGTAFATMTETGPNFDILQKV